MPASRPDRKLTYEDYCQIPEDRQRHEILDGGEVMTPAPFVTHQRAVTTLARLLDTWCRNRNAGVVCVAPTDVLLSPHDIVQPDVLFVSKERLGIVTEKNIQGAPDLVIEVLSESTRRRDLLEKRDLYGRAGVREYWVVDTDAERIEVFRPQGSELVKAAELWADKGDRLISPLLDGFDEAAVEVFA